jgi:hypothetical protein
MSKKVRRSAEAALFSAEKTTVFHPSDVLYALEWAAVAPGLGGWNLVLDDDRHTRLVSIVPPGAEHPVFFVNRFGNEITMTWLRQKPTEGTLVEVGTYKSLREAVLTLCPLSDDQRELVNESMEVLYPRARRDE